ncbi:MAG TPA: LON peptidase substrate-binding domain-containing protein [Opitutaceae bacterium]|nr:LON peptidase substrate-binding domain-containing protein [Opitutaceae bacterium]
MEMTEMEITVPEIVPVITLPKTAFFPQALMPLHIFEPRYQLMLRDALATNRLFAVAGLDPKGAGGPAQSEPPHRVATVGIIRACQKNDDGTANLLLQGLCRVEIMEIVEDEPYRRIRVRTLSSEAGATPAENESLRSELARLLNLRQKLGHGATAEMTTFLKSVEDPEAFVDIAAFSLCESPVLKQKLLETLDVHRRLQLFRQQVRRDIQTLKLRRKLQGKLPDDRIELN